jgi:hypothetical protein
MAGREFSSEFLNMHLCSEELLKKNVHFFFTPLASCSYFYYYNKNNNKNEARALKNKNFCFFMGEGKTK